MTQIKLKDAVLQHVASPRDARVWQALELSRDMHRTLHEEMPLEQALRLVDVRRALVEPVVDLLASGEWSAEGCRGASPPPAPIAPDVWERHDADPEFDLDIWNGTLRWSHDHLIDLITIQVEPAKPDRPKRASPRTIATQFAEWAASLPDWPSGDAADTWAKNNNYTTTIVRRLQSDGTPRTAGRPRKSAE